MPKLPRAFWVWFSLTLCATLVLMAMLSLTHSITSAEHARALAQDRADLEERTRLALWRMDTFGTSLAIKIAQTPFPDSNTPDPTWTGIADESEPEVRLRFVLNHHGDWISPAPQSPPNPVFNEFSQLLRQHPSFLHAPTAPASTPPAEERLKTNEDVATVQRRTDPDYQVQSNVTEKNYRAQAVEQSINAVNNTPYQGLNVQFAKPSSSKPIYKKHPLQPPAGTARAGVASESVVLPSMAQSKSTHAIPKPSPIPQAPSAPPHHNEGDSLEDAAATHDSSPTKDREFAGLQQPKPETSNDLLEDEKKEVERAPQAPAAKLQLDQVSLPTFGPMQCYWLGKELILIRKVTDSDHPQTPTWHGVWLNADKIQQNLIQNIADLLPNANLQALTNPNDANSDPMSLASFPFRLIRAENTPTTLALFPHHFDIPLMIAWLSVTIAFIMATLLIRGIIRLSERRASFVSAVTHELRTPLTTFRLYSEMLESGAVKEEKRGTYLRVLTREADRLSHLVENVLAFSRIERGTARSSHQTIAIASFLANHQERLESRLAAANLALVIETVDNPSLKTDTAALDHILFNLIDNAAKYATNSKPARVTIRTTVEGNFAHILVSDHGPGIPHSERKRIFKAFHKSALQAAESKPGVGLGLSLSQRLARELHGSLTLVSRPPHTRGAQFLLKLPLAPV